jgi:hypothetical protein
MADASIFGPNGGINPDFMAQLTALSGNGPQTQEPTQWGMNPYGSPSVPTPGGSGGTDLLSILSQLGKVSGAAGGGAGGSGLGLNLPTLNAGINGIAQLGGLYLGIKQLGLAKDSFKLQKQAYKTNLANQTQSYNTQVSDRIAGRNYNTEEERQAALKAALLPTGG